MSRNNGKSSWGFRFLAILVVLVVVAVFSWRMFSCASESSFSVESSEKIDVTPSMITSVKAIGQWEFLAIRDEEMIDTIRKGWFKDDELMRIYYGTLRLGIDLAKTRDGWIRAEADSVVVTVPDIQLLDEAFIDEARTRSFFEQGDWSETDKGKLYYIADKRMRARCLTTENIKTARANGEEQIKNLFKSVGFKKVRVRFEKNFDDMTEKAVDTDKLTDEGKTVKIDLKK